VSICSWEANQNVPELRCVYCARVKDSFDVQRWPLHESQGCSHGGWAPGATTPHVFVDWGPQYSIECLCCNWKQARGNLVALPPTCPRTKGTAPRPGQVQTLGLNTAPPPQTMTWTYNFPVSPPVTGTAAYLPDAPLIPICDLELSPNTDEYRCKRCAYRVSYGEYAREVSRVGYFSAPDCVALTAGKPGKRCADCRRDWCEVLDSYYGRDAWAAARCAKCRTKKP
jgi:hypothetical protein